MFPYHIDGSLRNKIGVDRVHCLVTLDRILLLCTVLVENVDSGRGHCLPSSADYTLGCARVKKSLKYKELGMDKAGQYGKPGNTRPAS